MLHSLLCGLKEKKQLLPYQGEPAVKAVWGGGRAGGKAGVQAPSQAVVQVREGATGRGGSLCLPCWHVRQSFIPALSTHRQALMRSPQSPDLLPRFPAMLIHNAGHNQRSPWFCLDKEGGKMLPPHEDRLYSAFFSSVGARYYRARLLSMGTRLHTSQRLFQISRSQMRPLLLQQTPTCFTEHTYTRKKSLNDLFLT